MIVVYEKSYEQNQKIMFDIWFDGRYVLKPQSS